MKIKICGLSRKVDIDYVNEANPDYMGFVFAKSKRQVTQAQAKELRSHLSDAIIPIGVFVDAPIDQVAGLLNQNIIDIAQLHGNEDDDYIYRLRKLTNKKIMKAFRVRSGDDIEAAKQSMADFLLLDAYTPHQAGGTGNVFDWNLVNDLGKPFFLAGGINIDNVEDAMRIARPYSIDLSSSVETEGLKDRNKINEIVRKIKNSAYQEEEKWLKEDMESMADNIYQKH